MFHIAGEVEGLWFLCVASGLIWCVSWRLVLFVRCLVWSVSSGFVGFVGWHFVGFVRLLVGSVGRDWKIVLWGLRLWCFWINGTLWPRRFFDRLSDSLRNLRNLYELSCKVGSLRSYSRRSWSNSHRGRSRNKGSFISIILELELLNSLINTWMSHRLRGLLNINNRSVIVVDVDVAVDKMRVGSLIGQLIIDHYFLLSSLLFSGDCWNIATILDDLLSFSNELQGLNIPIDQGKIVNLTEGVSMSDALQTKWWGLNNPSSSIECKFSDPNQCVFLLLRHTSPIVHLIHQRFLWSSHAAYLDLIHRGRHEFGPVDCTVSLEGVLVVILGTSDASKAWPVDGGADGKLGLVLILNGFLDKKGNT